MSGPYPYAGYGGGGYPPIPLDPAYPGAPGGPQAGQGPPRTPGSESQAPFYSPTAPTAPAAYPPAYPSQGSAATAYPVPTYNGGGPPPANGGQVPGYGQGASPAYQASPYPPQSVAPPTSYPPYGVPFPPAPGGSAAYPVPAGAYPPYPQVTPPQGGAPAYPPVPGDQGSKVYGQPEGRSRPGGHYQPGPYPVPATGASRQQVTGPAMQTGYSGQVRPQHQRPRKKALVIGCNYPGTNAELKGCINDANYMKHMLMTKFKFPEENIRVMTDDQGGPLRPTKRNIFAGFMWLVQGAQNGDRLFLHFSGHGSQKRDYSGEEKDGFNETLLPTDYRTEGQIIDDEVNIRVVNPLPNGVVLHCVIDACHSGTAMDLQYYTKCRQGRFEWKDNYMYRKPARSKGTSGGIAFQFGACKDSQVAQDTAELGGTNSGAATYSFIEAIEMGDINQSYGQILCHMQKSMDKLARINGDNLGGGVVGMLVGKVMGIGKQTPQLSCSSMIDLGTPLMV